MASAAWGTEANVNRRVLVVEDEFLLALDLQLTLEEHGWEVLGPVSSVAEAIAVLREQRPTVAVLDIRVADGLITPVAELLCRLGVPFVLASAYDVPAEHAAVLARAPNLGKPPGEKRLLAALTRAAGGS